jgi:hypothetical protein
MSNDLHRLGEAVLASQLAKATTRKPVEQPGKPTGWLRLQALDACHDAAPSATNQQSGKWCAARGCSGVALIDTAGK